MELQGYSNERMFFSKSGQNQTVPQKNNKLCNSRYTSRPKMLTGLTLLRFSAVNDEEA